MEQYIAEFVIAIISMIGTASGAYFANKKSTALVAYRLEQLEKKQDVHNQVIDRVYQLEKHVALNILSSFNLSLIHISEPTRH